MFPAGVASFDPTTEGVLLWTLCSSPAGVRWEVAADDAFTDIVASGTATTQPQVGVVHVPVEGLAAGTTYWYRFTAGAATSVTGRTRTLSRKRPGRIRIGVTCCARYGQACFDVYRALALEDLDVVVHLGDYIYEDTKCDVKGREPDPPHDCVTLEDYRRRHLQCRTDPDLQLLHRMHPMVAVWDDHDIADNAARTGSDGHDDETQGPWTARLEAATTAHHEFLPKRLADPEDPTTAWRRLDAGSHLAILCTETRAHRDRQSGVDHTPPPDDPDRTMLGLAQRRWLTEAAADPEPAWTILLSGTVVSDLIVDAPDALDGVLPEKYQVLDGKGHNTDQWDGYIAERKLLVDALRRRGGRSVVLSGDIHSSWAIEGPGDERGAVAVELTVPPAATTPLGQLLPPGVGRLLGPAVAANLEAVRWMDADHRGYLTLDVLPERIEATWWWVDTDDEDRRDEHARVRLAGGGTEQRALSYGAAPVRGRRFTIPGGPLPVRLVDPELADPSATTASEGAGDSGAEGGRNGPGTAAAVPSPLSEQRRRRQRRIAIAAGSSAAVGTALVGWWVLRYASKRGRRWVRRLWYVRTCVRVIGWLRSAARRLGRIRIPGVRRAEQPGARSEQTGGRRGRREHPARRPGRVLRLSRTA